MKKGRRFLGCVLLSGVLLLTACGQSQGGSSSKTKDEGASLYSAPAFSQAESQPVPEGTLNPLTGEYTLDEAEANLRPVAVMVNNIDAAIPHRGLSGADIIYEVPVEGGITRMLAVFPNLNAMDYVGPVRSVRHYYTDLAYPYDPIFIHFGGSKPGKQAVVDRGLDNIDGLVYGTTAFYKDEARANERGVEHSYFINGESVSEVAAQRGYSLEGTPQPLLSFSEEPVVPDRGAKSVYVSFSGYANDRFDFDPETGLYVKYRKGALHIDENTGEALAFTNVLVLVTSVTDYTAGSPLREVSLGQGRGYAFTGGGVEEITWSKGGYQNQFSFCQADGSVFKANPGKTFVCIIDASTEGLMEIIE